MDPMGTVVSKVSEFEDREVLRDILGPFFGRSRALGNQPGSKKFNNGWVYGTLWLWLT